MKPLKTLSLTLLSLMSLLHFSCKKENINQNPEQPKTYFEFKNLMSKDDDIAQFNKLASTIAFLKEYEDIPSLANNYKPTKNKLSYNIDDLKKIKSKSELINFYKNAGIKNADTLVNLMYQQRSHIVSFIHRMPNFKNLSLEERISLLKETFRKEEISKLINARSSSNLQKLALVDSDQQCGQSFNLGLNDCYSTWQYTLYGIYAGAFVAEAAAIVYSGGAGTGLVVDGTMIAVGIAYMAYQGCQDSAANQYYICVGAGHLAF